MRKLMLIAAIAALSACMKNDDAAAPTNDANVAEVAVPAVTPAAFTIMKTS